MIALIYIFIGGGLGSLSRFGFGYITKRYFDLTLPLGTFISNTVSCLIVGLAIYLFKDKIGQSSWIEPLILIGFCGGLSTFSTFSNETAQLIHQGNWFWAILNILISVATGIGLIYWLRFK